MNPRSEVSYRELGQMCGLGPVTVERYIDYDNGIRNAIIKNFNSLSLRQDSGALWENFCITERMKWLNHETIFANRFFWRTHAQQEIDYIEEREGKLFAFEFKWNRIKRTAVPRSFLDAYPGSETMVVTPDNLESFVLDSR
jgi:predicted AAA+ superfamily ATPase